MTTPSPKPHARNDEFLWQLRELPRAEFAATLYEQLCQQEPQPPSLLLRLFSPRVRTVTVAALVLLLLSTTFTVPALARILTTLTHSVPREITPPTAGALPVLTPQGPVTYAPTPTGVRQDTLEQVSEAAGFPVLVPTYLPPGCYARERFAWAELQVINLNYACVLITEQTVRSERPPVGAGATETVVVGDQPAIYIRGAWVAADAFTPPALRSPTPVGRTGPPPLVWQEDFAQELILERGGVIIHLRAGSPHFFPKEELIRIAASLAPLR